MSAHPQPTTDDVVPTPAPATFPLVWRLAIGTAWFATVIATSSWISTIAFGNKVANDLRTLVVTGLVISTLVTIGAALRRGQLQTHCDMIHKQDEILAEIKRTRPGYEQGYTQGHADGTAATLESVSAYLPTTPLHQANGNVHYLGSRRN